MPGRLPSAATFVECVNDKDERYVWVARKGTDEVKEERVFHRLWCQVWVVTKTFRYNGSKRGEDSGEFVDESRKDISGLAQIRVISPAEKCSSKLPPIVKACTDRMSQRRFADSG
jgi:hypothetical protein